MKRILVPVGCRSDAGLSAPVIKQLKNYFEVDTIQLEAQKFGMSYTIMENRLKASHYDFVLIVGDRVEMCAAASAAFHNKVRMGHFYAGVENYPVTTYDDVDRHCITLWSDLQFCESKECCLNVARLKDYHISDSFKHDKQLEGLGIYNVGISHMDDIDTKCKYKNVLPYDLVLINSEPIGKKHFSFTGVPGRKIIQVGGNPDGNTPRVDGAEYYTNLPRNNFLWLLGHCQRFITNSSAAYYEAPFYLKPEQIVLVGSRNCNRTPVPLTPGASYRIARILARVLQ